MRILIAAVLALALTGCADSDFVEHPITSLIPSWGDDAQPAQPAPADMQAAENSQAAPGTAAQPAAAPTSMAAAQPQPSSTTVSNRCRKLAKQRSGDAAYAGEDEKTQQSVYDRTYADCVAWDTRHAS